MDFAYKKIKQPTSSMSKYYKDLFIRNQSKWIRRSKLEPSHIDSEFLLEGSKYFLRGSVNSNQVLIESVETAEFMMVNIDLVTDSILGGE
jgi:hypothetical protein